MPKLHGNIQLSSYEDIFGGTAAPALKSQEDAGSEQVQDISLSELHPFKDHPFKILDDEAMDKTVESIKEFGVLTPAIVRPRDEGGYEIVSGHRRCHASKIAGKETLPCIVRDLDDDSAVILMVDANLQREELLPSERAKALKMKLEAIKHQGKKRLGISRNDELTSRQLVGKYLGREYVWGGSNPTTGFDCSGFVCWVINHTGWHVGRTTAQGLRKICTQISQDEAQPGDLIFFQGTYDTPGASHVGIYVGNGMMIHCGNPISYTSVTTKYWQNHFLCYGRLPET